MLNYLKWRGDLTFSNDKFNKIDALICSRISYFPLDNIGLYIITLKKSLEYILSLDNLDEFLLWPADKDLMKELLKSRRYLEVKISDFVNKIDIDKEKQFSAVTIHLDDSTMFISYRGTDNTIIGWKENLNMSFSDHVPAQLESIEYINKILNKYPNKKVIIGGHSKGGNLAIYSSIFCKEDYKKRIIEVYNFDGPGFNRNILKDYRYKEISDKIKTYIPEEAVVGIILERLENVNVVKSTESHIMQHDVYSWEIEGKEFIYLDELSKESKILDDSITELLENTNSNEREEIINALFDIISSVSNEENITSITRSWTNATNVLIQTMRNPKLKDIFYKTISIILEQSRKQIIIDVKKESKR